MPVSAQLAKATCASLIAPAGYGKTHLISDAIALAEGKPQLVLTHTHAGVGAITKRMKQQGVASSKYRVETLDGWALKWAAAYPQLSGVAREVCLDCVDWLAIREGALKVFESSFCKAVVQNTYGGVFVDEYQDCGQEQHSLVLALAELIPTRVLGDPLQGIFDFGGNLLVDWEDVRARFPALPSLTVPWRWRNTNEELGNAIAFARANLEAHNELDLADENCRPIQWVPMGGAHDTIPKLYWNLQRHCNQGEKIAVIFPLRRQAYSSAKMLKGTATALETVECGEVCQRLDAIFSSEGAERGLKIIEMLSDGMTKVSEVFKSSISAMKRGELPSTKRLRNHVESVELLLLAIESGHYQDILNVVSHYQALAGVVVFRKEYVARLKRVLTCCCYDPALSIENAVAQVRERDRLVGRRDFGHVVGTTLLLKGLEFDHVIIAEAQMYDHKNLYVALSRGTKSVFVVSRSRLLGRGA